MQNANVTKRHQANMTSLVTLQALSNDDLFTKKIKSKIFVLKNLSVYIKRVALLDPIKKQL